MKKLSFVLLLAALVALSGCAGGLKPKDRSQTIGGEKQSIAERSSKTKAAMSSYTTKAAPVGADTVLLSDSEEGHATKKASISTMRAALGLGTTADAVFGSVNAAGGTLSAGVANTTQGTLVLYTNTNPVYAFGLSPAASPSATVSLKAPAAMPSADNSLFNCDINGTCDWTDPATLGGFDEAGNYTPTGTWDFTSATVSGLPGASYTAGTDISITEGAIALSWDKDYADLINKPTLGTAAALNHGTSIGDLMRFTDAGTCSDSQYTTEATCESNTETWTAALGVPFTIDTADLTDTTNLFGGSMTYPSSGNFGYTSNGTSWTAMGLDTDLASTSASDDTVPSAKAVKAALDGISVAAPTVQSADPTSASAEGWYAATGSGDIFYKSSAGLFAIAGTYTADPVTPTLTSRVIGTNGTSLTLTGSASLSVGAGDNGGFDVDCSTAGSNITATYASGAPGTDLVYALGTPVNSGDTCDLDYAQPGDGIEATTGGADLASITSGAITNNSTQSPGGVLLVGDDSTSITDDNTGYTDPTQIIGRLYTASSSGTAAKGYARIRANTATTDVKMVIASSDGTILAVSSPTSVTTSYANYEFTFSSGSITSSTSYKLGIVSESNAILVASNGATWETIQDTSNSYTSPTTFDGNNGSGATGRFRIWVTN